MAQNKVEVLLVAKDNISATIRGMRGNIASGINDAIGTIATLGAAIAASAVAFSSLGAGFNKAADLQTSQITNAYTLATVIGSTVSDAKKAVKDLNIEMAALGDQLPGVTEDYQKFATTLSATVAVAAKGNMGDYKKMLTEASKYGGLMVATSGADGTQGASALNRYLGGTMSQGEAKQQDIMAKNPNYKLFEADAMKKMGLAGKDWQKQMTTSQRLAVFNLANSMMFTPAQIAAYGNTADTQFQALKSKLFNPVTGIFGFARVIKGLDGRSALDAVTTFMGQLDIMSTQAGKWLAAHGINLDPMEAIGHMMDTASGWASAFTALMKGDKSGIKTMLADLGKGFNKIDGKKTGTAIATVMNGLGSMLMSIKIEDITAALNQAVIAVSTGLAGVDWSNFGAKLADGLAKAMQTFDWVKAGNTLDQAYFAAVNALAEFIRGSGNHLNRALSKATGYTDDKSTPTQKAAMDKDDKVKHQFFDNLFGGNRLDPEKSKGAKDITGQPLSSLPQLGQMSNSGSVFSPVINITGGMADSAQQTADYVLEAINNKYLQYRQEALV